jgi:acyl phosphate:glycerol-3-phosphate acyltransferase
MWTDFLIAGVLGYLLGAVPTGYLIVKWFSGVDLRTQGSGHTGGLNTLRSAGIWGGVATALGDLLLGAGATYGALLLTGNPRAAAVAGILAVAGHNWSVFINFGGGIGLAKLAGGLLGLSTLTALIAVPIAAAAWGILILLLHLHRARATIFVIAAAVPLIGLISANVTVTLLIAGGALLVIIKTLPDWNRVYRKKDPKTVGAEAGD